MSDVLQRLLTETWPARLAKSAMEALMLPGEGYQGKFAVQPEKPGWITEGDLINQGAADQELMRRSNDLAGLLTLGAGAVPAEAHSLRAGMKYLPSSQSLATPPAPTAAEMLRASRVESVPLSQAKGTQPKMNWEKFDKGDHPGPLIEGYADKPVAVRREDGEYLIFDGHHRTARALNDGKQNLDMYVINAKDYAPQYAGRKPAPSRISDDDLLKELFGK